MLPNPEMTLRLVRDHRRDLLREAELERRAAQARADRPRLTAGALRPFAAALAVVARAVKLHQASAAGQRPSAAQMLASTER